MMREVLERRFARLEKEDPDRQSGDWPDLVLIDGGKGQLSAVCEVMEDMVPKPFRLTAGSCSRAITARGRTRTRAGSRGICSKRFSPGRLRSNVLGETPVKLRPAVAEEAEGRAMLLRLAEV